MKEIHIGYVYNCKCVTAQPMLLRPALVLQQVVREGSHKMTLNISLNLATSHIDYTVRSPWPGKAMQCTISQHTLYVVNMYMPTTRS